MARFESKQTRSTYPHTPTHRHTHTEIHSYTGRHMQTVDKQKRVRYRICLSIWWVLQVLGQLIGIVFICPTRIDWLWVLLTPHWPRSHTHIQADTDTDTVALDYANKQKERERERQNGDQTDGQANRQADVCLFGISYAPLYGKDALNNWCNAWLFVLALKSQTANFIKIASGKCK